MVHRRNSCQADDIPHAAVHASRCSCQPDVSSSERGGEELPGCQLASNRVNDAAGNGAGPEVVAAVCRGASALAWLVHMEAAGGGDGVTDQTPEGFLVAVLPPHTPQPRQHRLHNRCRSRRRGISQQAKGRKVLCCTAGGSGGGKEARAAPHGKGGKQQGGRERRVGPAKPWQQHSQCIRKRWRLQQPISQLSGGSPGSMHPGRRQRSQQRRQPLHSIEAAGKGGVAAEHGGPHKGVGSTARRRRHRLLQVKELAQGGHASSREVDEVVINASGEVWGAEVQVAPQRRRPAPRAQHQRLLSNISHWRQAAQAGMQAPQRRRQLRYGARRRLPSRPQQQAHRVDGDISTTAQQSTCYGYPRHGSRGQQQLQSPPGVTRGDVLAPGQSPKATIRRPPGQHPASKPSKLARGIAWGLAAVHHLGSDAHQLSHVLLEGVARELCMVKQLRDAIRRGGKAAAKGREAGKGGYAGKAAPNTTHECRPAGGRVCSCPKGDTQGSGLANNPQAVHNGREPSRHITNGEEGGLGWVEALPSGSTKGIHGRQKGGHSVEGGQQRLSVVIVLQCGELLASHWDANAAGLEQLEQGLRNKEVKEGGKGAALPHASQKGCRRGGEAVHHGVGPGVGQEQAGEGEEARPHPKGIHSRKEELPINRVIGFAKVTEHNHSYCRALYCLHTTLT
ncbi:hypothetical protein ACK3TF_000454 [Chlorella vulgaris]